MPSIFFKYLVICQLCLGCASLWAQDNQYLTSEDSDPEAIEQIEAMESYIAEHKKFRADFEIRISRPAEEDIQLEGIFVQDDRRFQVKMTDYEVYCNGTTRWVYSPDFNEVTIYDANSDGTTGTPLDYIRAYASEDYAMRFLEDPVTGSTGVEFKPLDRYSDYTKIRLVFENRDPLPRLIELFERGGERTILRLNDVNESITVNENMFNFDVNAHPDIIVEDLRME